MSEEQSRKGRSNASVVLFMVILSVSCAVVLSLLASALKEPQEIAKELDRSEEMMIAARIFTHDKHFLMKDDKGNYIFAKYSGDGVLVPGDEKDIATSQQILEVYKKRFVPMLVDKKGNILSFEKARLDMKDYIAKHRKSGYYKQDYKLIYEILPNLKREGGEGKEVAPIGYIIPVNGYGLWDAIYGYLAVEPNGETVIGISWYDQKETPGLGANIAENFWQKLFYGKKIFQPSASGKIDPATAPIGIVVIKGKVAEVLGDSSKAKSAVDGMAGATLTGNGVTNAYRDVLSAYRPFFINVHKKVKENNQG